MPCKVRSTSTTVGRELMASDTEVVPAMLAVADGTSGEAEALAESIWITRFSRRASQ
jgi:hypothetical protein